MCVDEYLTHKFTVTKIIINADNFNKYVLDYLTKHVIEI